MEASPAMEETAGVVETAVVAVEGAVILEVVEAAIIQPSILGYLYH